MNDYGWYVDRYCLSNCKLFYLCIEILVNILKDIL